MKSSFYLHITHMKTHMVLSVLSILSAFSIHSQANRPLTFTAGEKEIALSTCQHRNNLPDNFHVVIDL